MATRSSARQKRNPSALVLDTSRLGRRPGSMITVHETVPSPVRIGLDFLAIEKDSDIDLDLRLESVSEGVLVTGTVYAATRGECTRCLGPVDSDIEIMLTELYAYPDSVTESTTEEDEVGRVVDQTVDIQQPIIDAVGLALPFAPLCVQDCPGLCPDCGTALATAEPGHHHDKVDPRWSKLAKIFPDGDGVGGDGTDPDQEVGGR